MVKEPEGSRPAKGAIIHLAVPASNADGGSSCEDLAAKIEYFASMLRSHIAREDQVPYPLAYHTVPDSEEREFLKQACDTVGYCPFFPGVRSQLQSDFPGKTILLKIALDLMPECRPIP